VHIELIDLLRCPEPHEETWLVAAFNRMSGRDVIDATLGCPLCKREFVVREGVVIFGDAVEGKWLPGTDPTYIAAYLNMTSPGSIVLLAGAPASQSSAIAEVTSAVVISLDASDSKSSERVLEFRGVTRLPLGTSSVDGVALDEAHSTDLLLSESARVLRPGGRLVVAAAASLPAQFHELARDADQIVAERKHELVTLERKT
jgi:uncharacterized protein YbaR (Trm112 family)